MEGLGAQAPEQAPARERDPYGDWAAVYRAEIERGGIAAEQAAEQELRRNAVRIGTAQPGLDTAP